MCTVSWLPTGDGYELFFNRDERTTRGPERPPREEELHGVPYLAPADSDAGGTWLLVNAFGLTVGLLNGYVESRAPRSSYASRGVLVRGLADAESAHVVHDRLTRDGDLGRFQPFVLLLRDADGPARVLHWDGLELRAAGPDDDLSPLASSGFDQPGAQLHRRARYREFLGPDARPTPEGLLAFHRDTGEGASAYTPCMQRDDAATRSLCHVRVDGERVTLAHAAGRPDRVPLGPALVLARRWEGVGA